MIDFFTFDKLSTCIQCRHAITIKKNTQPYAFSVALHTGEEKKQIVANRKQIVSILGWDENAHFIVANQTHSDNIVIIEKQKSLGWTTFEDAVENCDALISNQKNVILSVLTADCVPILMFDTKKNVIATVHAGWKGTQARIVSKTVEKMVDVFDSNPMNIIAGIGPAIGRCCYEVGEDVVKYFDAYPQAYDKIADKYMLDLPFINKEQLLSVGLDIHNIEMSDICTSCHVEKFFSYRKEKGCNGRFMSMIGLQ